ncbi:efflux transporter outer membrane subunit [Coralloluteibacterium stylophorae]|uniref:Efflux transporter outer membrane subunit n=1 Tax=Coralloluteibacterium stylophorae TaxID=1776034 RepID=A0A8J8AY44_9GAMM|nr:efflux transporter outer membrane subunit [Coralloluteibacterium stylophorae]MBS7458488.1 efflux transporter outer membrane subunit [Coralloluteibacterium stylophorae]
MPDRPTLSVPMSSRPLRLALACVLACAGGCAVGPDYVRPDAPVPVAWGEAVPAGLPQVGDGPWWEAWNDPVLDALIERVDLSNQSIAAAEASYRQARALVRGQRAAWFPTVSADLGASRSGGDASTVGDSGVIRGSNSRQVDLSVGASWEVDVWGRVRRSVEAARADAAASAADLAAARLSARGELATAYFQLREADAEIELLEATIEGYERALEITRNRYEAGIVVRSDVLQAESTLRSAQAERESLLQQRAQLAHAIAVLVGEAPARFEVTSAPWDPAVPALPLGLPSDLLRRRPDVAAAQWRMRSANASIGVAQADWFPSLTLTGRGTSTADTVGELVDAAVNTWSLALGLAQTVFDGGARSAQVESARASYEGTVADYRQTLLGAFQEVEDNLAAARALERRAELLAAQSEAADEAERIMLNRYRAGQVAYTDVVTAQADALSARRTLAQAMRDRQTTAVALVQAVGGDWSGRVDPAPEAG